MPLAGPAMYKALSPQWAGTLLGLLEVVLIPIPFVFYRWGAKIRMKSPLIRRMREEEERLNARVAKQAGRVERRRARAAILAGARSGLETDVEGDGEKDIQTRAWTVSDEGKRNKEEAV